MATAPVTPTYGPGGHANGVLISWVVGAADVGIAFEGADFADRTVQFDGDFDSATVVLQGSNDGVTWFSLTDPQGNAISATSDKLEVIAEGPRFIRPSSSGGGGSTVVNVRVWARRNR